LTIRDLLQRSKQKDSLTDLLQKKTIKHTPELKTISLEIEQYVQALLSHITEADPLFRNTLIRSGSFYEGTKVDLPDEFDYMINLDEIQCLSQSIDDQLDPVGFTRLSPRKSSDAGERLSSYLEPVTGCLSSEKIRQRFYQLLTSARSRVISREMSEKFEHLKFEWTSGDKRCGTAINTECYGYEYPYLNIKIDVVPCVTVDRWPGSARIPCPFEPVQCHLIARSPQADQTHLWRISTSRAELFYFQSRFPEQINAYRILKILRQLDLFQCQIDQRTYSMEELITSYMLKNKFFYETQRYSQQEHWASENLLSRLLAILEDLREELINGCVQSFFIHNYNVIDMDDYRTLRSFQIEYLDVLLSKLRSDDQHLFVISPESLVLVDGHCL
jgi:hypothetical protein